MPVIDLAKRRASLILGEPGAGKTTVLLDMFSQLSSRLSTHVERFDFRQYSTELSIDTRLSEIRVNGSGLQLDKFLLLDSVDEVRVQFRNFVPFLQRTISALMADDWKVIATCRTAETVPALEDLFEEIDPDAVHVLLPLRRTDFDAIVVDRGLDPSVMIADLEANGLEFLASTPFTLGLLCECADAATSRIAMSRSEVFARAIELALGQRSNGSYTAPATAAFPPILQQLTAQRLAAFATLTGIPGIGLFRPGEAMSGLQTELMTGIETQDGATFEITHEHLQLVLSSALFVDSGKNQMEFAHRSFRDFLAAKCISRWDISVANVKSMLVTSTVESSIPPQMLEIAGWMLILEPNKFDWLMELDPWSLAKSGLGLHAQHLRHSLVERVMKQANAGDLILQWQDQLVGLNSSGLIEQLRPFVSDPCNETRVALRILRDSYSPGLEPELVRLINSPLTEISDRTAALGILAAREVHDYLRLIDWEAEGFFAGDSRAELRGALLTALWPQLMSTTQVTDLLIAPPSGYIGAYSMFLYGMERELTPTDAAVLIRWRSERVDIDPEEDFGSMRPIGGQSFRQLVSRAAELWWETYEVADSADWPSAVKVVATYLHRSKSQLPLSRPAIKRDDWHRLMNDLVTLLRPDQLGWYTLLRASDRDGNPLLSQDDLPWLATQAADITDANFEVWARLFDQLIDVTDAAQIELAWGTQGTRLWDRIRYRFDAIQIDSPEAIAARENAARLSPTSDETGTRGMTSEHYLSSIRSIIADVQADIARFWHLVRWLDVDLQRGTYGGNSDADLFASESSALLDEPTRLQVIELARRYLEHCGTDNMPTRMRRNAVYYEHVATYTAAATLAQRAPEKLFSNSSIDWPALIPALFPFPLSYDPAAADRAIHRKLLSHASSQDEVRTRTEGFKFLTRVAMGWAYPSAIEDLAVLVDELWWPHLRAVLALATGHLYRQVLELADGWNSTAVFNWCRAHLDDSTHELPATFSHLLESDTLIGFESLTDFIRRRPSVVAPTLLDIAQSERHGAGHLLSIDPDLRLTLFALLADLFPRSADPSEDGMHAVSPREDLAQWRDSLLASVVRDGSQAAVVALATMHSDRPDLGLEYALVNAREAFRINGWLPVPINELLEVLENSRKRLIRSSEDLLSAAAAELDVLQGWLNGETPQSFALWNRHKGFESPKGENSISDWYCHGLRLRFSDTSVVINREVEVLNRSGVGSGLRQDIRIEMRNPAAGEQYVVVIEVKGIWNPEVQTNLPAQLVREYLVEGKLTHGVYLVVSFDPEHISESVRRSRARANLRGLSGILKMQASSAGEGLHVISVIHNADLPWAELPDIDAEENGMEAEEIEPTNEPQH